MLLSDRSLPPTFAGLTKESKEPSGTPSNGKREERPEVSVEPGGEAPKRPEKPKETLAENG